MIKILLRSETGFFITVSSKDFIFINGDYCFFVPDSDFNKFDEWAKEKNVQYINVGNLRRRKTIGIIIKSGINYFLIKNDSKA